MTVQKYYLFSKSIQIQRSHIALPSMAMFILWCPPPLPQSYQHPAAPMIYRIRLSCQTCRGTQWGLLANRWGTISNLIVRPIGLARLKHYFPWGAQLGLYAEILVFLCTLLLLNLAVFLEGPARRLGLNEVFWWARHIHLCSFRPR